MGKRLQDNRSIKDRLQDILAEIDRLLNPPRPVPVRVPVRVKHR
ncbi:MAG TPA: hypothetical protein VMT34_10095 [Aggregatilineales bacterium]|nr:hypothetical protein [Aggregatilineales bacterium]